MLRTVIRFLWRAFKIAIVLLIIAAVTALAVPVSLDVTGRSQYPSLPNGCESVAAISWCLSARLRCGFT